jgi:hypothetical protein
MSESDLWNMLSREDQVANGRAWSFRMAVTAEDADREPNALVSGGYRQGRGSAGHKMEPHDVVIREGMADTVPASGAGGDGNRR